LDERRVPAHDDAVDGADADEQFDRDEGCPDSCVHERHRHHLRFQPAVRIRAGREANDPT
jgi:hypothetical protein